jgi:hypothetical protein
MIVAPRERLIMNKKSHCRPTTDQRRRRLAATGTGVGITVGGAMAAAFISVGTASAVPETQPDPVLDLLQATQPEATQAMIAHADNADNALAMLNPTLATQLDANIDNAIATGNFLPSSGADADAFLDLQNAGDLHGNTGAVLDSQLPGLAQALDPYVDQLLGTPPPTDDLDPLADSAPNATGTELTSLTNADTSLATSNPELASRLDVLVDQAMANGGLPVGNPGDANAFSELGLANGPTLDADFATLSQQLDPLVDQALGTTEIPGTEIPTPPLGDVDPFTDLAQAFDPNAFTGAGAPADVIGAFATELDTMVASSGMGVALDTMADQIIAGFTTMTF